MVKPLLGSMDIVSSVPGLNVVTQQKIGWITAIKESDWLGLAKQCYVSKQSPVLRVKKLMMPNANYYVDNLGKYLIDCAPAILTSDDQIWLESCFYSLKTTQQRIEYCQQILAKYRKSAAGSGRRPRPLHPVRANAVSAISTRPP